VTPFQFPAAISECYSSYRLIPILGPKASLQVSLKSAIGLYPKPVHLVHIFISLSLNPFRYCYTATDARVSLAVISLTSPNKILYMFLVSSRGSHMPLLFPQYWFNRPNILGVKYKQ